MTPRFNDVGRTPSRLHQALIVVGFGVIYRATASWGYSANVDSLAAALPAWSLASDGTITLDRFAGLNAWVVESGVGYVSNSPPGIWLAAVPVYLVVQAAEFVNWPATAVGIAFTLGGALVVLYRVLCGLVGPTQAVATARHGTGNMHLAGIRLRLVAARTRSVLGGIGAGSLARNRLAPAGFWLGTALLTRPVTELSTAVIGLSEARRRRSWTGLAQIGAPAAAALAALPIYYRLVFGWFSVSGGYGGAFEEGFLGADLGGRVRLALERCPPLVTHHRRRRSGRGARMAVAPRMGEVDLHRGLGPHRCPRPAQPGLGRHSLRVSVSARTPDAGRSWARVGCRSPLQNGTGLGVRDPSRHRAFRLPAGRTRLPTPMRSGHRRRGVVRVLLNFRHNCTSVTQPFGAPRWSQ